MNRNSQTNRQPNFDRYSRRKRKRKKNLRIAAFLISLLVIFSLLIWGFISLCTSIFGNDESSSELPSEVHSENITSNAVSFEESISEPESVFSEESIELPEEEKIEWNLILVNSKNLIPEDFELNLQEVEGEPMRGGVPTIVDARIIEPLKQMMADARKDGILPKITSAYRSTEDQIAVMQDYIADYIAQGMTQEEAEAEAKNWVALPGASEHHLGLAVDISTADWNAQGADVVWAWFKDNCWKYGFILRYTEEWASVTGTSPEPWHFRYVGLEHSKAITDSGLPYEQYYEKYIKID